MENWKSKETEISRTTEGGRRGHARGGGGVGGEKTRQHVPSSRQKERSGKPWRPADPGRHRALGPRAELSL